MKNTNKGGLGLNWVHGDVANSDVDSILWVADDDSEGKIPKFRDILNGFGPNISTVATYLGEMLCVDGDILTIIRNKLTGKITIEIDPRTTG